MQARGKILRTTYDCQCIPYSTSIIASALEGLARKDIVLETDADGTDWYYMRERETGRRQEDQHSRSKAPDEKKQVEGEKDEKDEDTFDWVAFAAALENTSSSSNGSASKMLCDDNEEEVGKKLQSFFDKASRLQLDCQVLGQKLAKVAHQACLLSSVYLACIRLAWFVSGLHEACMANVFESSIPMLTPSHHVSLPLHRFSASPSSVPVPFLWPEQACLAHVTACMSFRCSSAACSDISIVRCCVRSGLLQARNNYRETIRTIQKSA